VSDLSNAASTLVYQWLFDSTATPTRPVGRFVALFTAVTDAQAGTGTEVTGGSYARISLAGLVNAATNGVGDTDEIDFGTPSADWGTVTHFGIFDAVSAGNPITALKALTTPRNCISGVQVKFNAGDLDLSIA
jgi:hypothetical protein